MRTIRFPVIALLVILALLISCKDDKPTAPATPAYPVTLEYRNYLGNIYCLRLMVGTNPIGQCGLGSRSVPVWEGDYDCKLYSITNPGPQEVLALIATSPLHLDRNFACVVDGNHIYWRYWD